MFLEVCLGTIYWSTSTRPGPVTQGLKFLNLTINILLDAFF